MIYVTVGSQKFQFNRLLKKIDELIDESIITERVVAQIGNSDYQPKNYEYRDYLDRYTYKKNINECNLVITHGGTGAIIEAVKNNKKVIAVPRLKKYGEHVDNHQLEIVKEFKDMGIICVCKNINDLDNYIKIIEDIEFLPFISNTNSIIKSIDEFIGKGRD